MGRWFLDFSAMDPRNVDKSWKVGIREDYYRRLQHHGHQKLVRLILVQETFDDPVRLYRGWSRPDKDDCYVYIGSPKHDYRSVSIETPPPPRQLFLVFVRPDGTIDDWMWREHVENAPETPTGVNGELIWQRKRPT
jgi:hypothetical protein